MNVEKQNVHRSLAQGLKCLHRIGTTAREAQVRNLPYIIFEDAGSQRFVFDDEAVEVPLFVVRCSLFVHLKHDFQVDGKCVSSIGNTQFVPFGVQQL